MAELEQQRFLKCKNRMIEELTKSIEFFSQENKWEREKMVVVKLLRQLGIGYDESELTKWEEPVDVAFRDARFQVKEVMHFQGEQPRRRHYELKAELRRIQAAETIKEMMRLTPFREETWDQIVMESVQAARTHTERYGPKERRNLDVVCYHNRQGHFEAPAITPEIEGVDCRSFSIVSNAHSMVLFADSSAPAFLQGAVGTRHAGRFD